MPDFELLYILLSAIDKKTLNLLRFYELQIDFLLSRMDGRLLPEESEKAALSPKHSSSGTKSLLLKNTTAPKSAVQAAPPHGVI